MEAALAPRPAATAEDRVALVEAVRRLLADRCAEADVRRIMDSDSGHDPDLWGALADLGVAGLTIDERHGGAGLGPVELGLVMEEIGASLAPVPMLSTILAAALLQALGDTKLLPEIADGSRIATVALTGPAADWTQAGVAVRADNDRLSGVARFVTDGAIADTILVVADAGVFAVDRGATGMTVTPLPTFDRTRRLADVAFDATPATPLGGGWREVSAALDVARVALASEAAGGARRMFEMTVDYARERHQFGRAIGSFQAIKHMAADLLLESESATSAARNAAQKLAESAPDTDAAIALAGFACADAFVKIAKDGIQMHGGIAFTWEHAAHLYLRRARSTAQLFGTPAADRERFIHALEAGA